MQVIALSPNSIVPAFKTRLRGAARLFMDVLSSKNLPQKAATGAEGGDGFRLCTRDHQKEGQRDGGELRLTKA
jgi:hypothetical protein